MKNCKLIMHVGLLIAISATAQDAAKGAQQPKVQPASDSAVVAAPKSVSASPMTMEQVIDRTVQREHALMSFLRTRTPLVETYLQNLKRDPELGAVPKDDRYFLGRLDLASTVERRDYLSKDESFEKNLLGGFGKLFKLEYNPMGFSWMIFADREEFDRAHYDFKYTRREFLGDVRCLVFDVTPKKDAGKGRFLGRIWVEDQDFNIVRLNGTYAPRPKNAYFFHMDSWRVNLIPGYWLPAYIYSEEGDFSYGSKDKMAFKAQTRIWGYDIQKKSQENELAQITVDSVKDESVAAADPSPLAAQRKWQQQAEDNVIERLESAGLLAPAGDVDKILLTVVNNLMITNNIELPGQVRTRTMLTSPLETFSVGNTIVVSRGLIDVLPDEACLAMVLSHELGHIVLGHNLGSKFAFTDRMLFSDQSTYQNFGFRHSPEEEAAADAKALELLKKSPYGSKLDSASLFLKELSARAPEISALLTPHLGNSFVNDKGQLVRMPALTTAGPELKTDKLDQIAALPLGGRLKVNPWDDRVEMVKAAPVTIVSVRDKMPFEVTPFFPHLTRMESGNPVATTTAANRTIQK
ncbi:MAG TPA: M48 family metalloprotease [Terriglobales bacterium]|nr:M48 family metalloprotease [Terriglobales bacterium]